MAGASDHTGPRTATEAALGELARKEGEHPVILRQGSADLPLVFDSPHSGRYYPADFRPVVSLRMLREYEDRFVDLLIERAPENGVMLVAANFPRAYVDPNRAADDIDETMLEAVWPEPVSPTRHSELGTGLIFRTMRDDSPIYDRRLTVEEVSRRIEACWRPYHDTLENALQGAWNRHGAVWHINWHSMLPVGNASAPDPGCERADFVLGDLRGESCEPAFTAIVAEELEARGYSVAVNEPYQGAYIVERHGRPDEGRHSLQIEINRALYMNLDTLEKIERFEAVRDDLGRLSNAVAEWVGERTGR